MVIVNWTLESQLQWNFIKNTYLKISSAKWRPFCLGVDGFIALVSLSLAGRPCHSENVLCFLSLAAEIERLGAQPMLDLLNVLGGWPVLDPNWNGAGLNLPELMADLAIMKRTGLVNYGFAANLTYSAVNSLSVISDPSPPTHTSYMYIHTAYTVCYVNTLRPGQNGRHFADKHFQVHFLEWKLLNVE